MGSKPLRIMIIDDEEIVCKRLKSALGKDGSEVEVFEQPKLALECFEKDPFDIVVTDIRMDDIDGLEVLQQVLSLSSRTKVILITGYATVEVAREALTKGAFDFIAKPFKPNDLRSIIKRAVKAQNSEEGATV